MKKQYLLSFVLIALSIVMIGCGNNKEIGSVHEKQLKSESISSEANEESESSKEMPDTNSPEEAGIPTLFIHGYEGTDFTFNGMLSRFEDEGYGEKQLTLTIQPDGSISEIGDWHNDSAVPFIQVLFADNKNSEWNQADWIKAILVYLKTTYQIEEVNVVGHSMGGVSSFRYLVAYGNEKTQPTVKNFIAIGAPFNDFVTGNENQTLEDLKQNGPLVLSGRYSEFATAIQHYPASTTMLNIAGDVEDGSKSDGTVSLSSSLSIGYLMEPNKRTYYEEIVSGKKASHSQLHENEKVDERIREFLKWKK